jgi:hypothetical protein
LLADRLSGRRTKDIIDDDLVWYLTTLWEQYDAAEIEYIDEKNVNMALVRQSIRMRYNQRVLGLGDQVDAPRPLEHLRAEDQSTKSTVEDKRVAIIAQMLENRDIFKTLGIAYYDIMNMAMHELDDLVDMINAYVQAKKDTDDDSET